MGRLRYGIAETPHQRAGRFVGGVVGDELAGEPGTLGTARRIRGSKGQSSDRAGARKSIRLDEGMTMIHGERKASTTAGNFQHILCGKRAMKPAQWPRSAKAASAMRPCHSSSKSNRRTNSRLNSNRSSSSATRRGHAIRNPVARSGRTVAERRQSFPQTTWRHWSPRCRSRPTRRWLRGSS